MIHVFVLYVILNGDTVSQDMAWRNINECSSYAQRVVKSKFELSGRYEPRAITIAAYCIPRKVNPDTTNLIIY